MYLIFNVMTDRKVTDVITPENELVRFSYAHVFEPTSMEEGQEKKYSVTILIPKNNKKTLAMIEAAIEEAKQEGKKSKWGGKIPPAFKHELLRDGDIEKPDNEEYGGHYFISAKNPRKPKVWDAKGREIGEEDFYSGCYGRVSITIYPYAKGAKGIGAQLNAVLKVEDGERLSGSSAKLEDFGISQDDLLG